MAQHASKATNIEKTPITKNDFLRPIVFINKETGAWSMLFRQRYLQPEE